MFKYCLCIFELCKITPLVSESLWLKDLNHNLIGIENNEFVSNMCMEGKLASYVSRIYSWLKNKSVTGQLLVVMVDK